MVINYNGVKSYITEIGNLYYRLKGGDYDLKINSGFSHLVHRFCSFAQSSSVPSVYLDSYLSFKVSNTLKSEIVVGKKFRLLNKF